MVIKTVFLLMEYDVNNMYKVDAPPRMHGQTSNGCSKERRETREPSHKEDHLKSPFFTKKFK